MIRAISGWLAFRSTCVLVPAIAFLSLACNCHAQNRDIIMDQVSRTFAEITQESSTLNRYRDSVGLAQRALGREDPTRACVVEVALAYLDADDIRKRACGVVIASGLGLDSEAFRQALADGGRQPGIDPGDALFFVVVRCRHHGTLDDADRDLVLRAMERPNSDEYWLAARAIILGKSPQASPLLDRLLLGDSESNSSLWRNLKPYLKERATEPFIADRFETILESEEWIRHAARNGYLWHAIYIAALSRRKPVLDRICVFYGDGNGLPEYWYERDRDNMSVMPYVREAVLPVGRYMGEEGLDYSFDTESKAPDRFRVVVTYRPRDGAFPRMHLDYEFHLELVEGVWVIGDHARREWTH